MSLVVVIALIAIGWVFLAIGTFIVLSVTFEHAYKDVDHTYDDEYDDYR